MTPDEVRERYARVVEIDQSGDWEEGHIHEDNLMLVILRAIADGVDAPQALAAAFVEACDAHQQNDRFDRWYA